MEYLGPTCRKTNPMVDHKKKKVRIVQKLCKKHYSINPIIDNNCCGVEIKGLSHEYEQW
jgi:hypothetical protein